MAEDKKKKICIDKNLCTLCGTCVALYPEIFKFSDDMTEVIVNSENVKDEEIDAILDVCPTGAIKQGE